MLFRIVQQRLSKEENILPFDRKLDGGPDQTKRWKGNKRYTLDAEDGWDKDLEREIWPGEKL